VDEIRVPDDTRPVAGARVWTVARTMHQAMGGMLWPLNASDPWRMDHEFNGWPVAVARCPRDPEHVPPVEGCGCGFWACLTPMEAFTGGFGFGASGNAVGGAVGGVVSGLGDVLVGQKVWRAQYARVEAIFDHPSIPSDGLPYSKEQIARSYGAEIIAPHEFEELCFARGLQIESDDL
jgi:hypothetical protein